MVTQYTPISREMLPDPLEFEGDGSLVDEIRLVSFSVYEGGIKSI